MRIYLNKSKYTDAALAVQSIQLHKTVQNSCVLIEISGEKGKLPVFLLFSNKISLEINLFSCLNMKCAIHSEELFISNQIINYN